VVVDECAYEGNNQPNWGQHHGRGDGAAILGRRGTRRLCSARRDLHAPQDILWWSKGGTLHGQSPARIAFLRASRKRRRLPTWTTPRPDPGRATSLRRPARRYYLYYYGFNQPTSKTSRCRKASITCVVIDTWAMTIRELPAPIPAISRLICPQTLHGVRLEKAGD
jgi:hypothetical protein